MHYFYDFKGFKKAEINLFNPFTVLIGPNGSGKSNTIEAVELLSFIVHGGPLHEIGDISNGGYVIKVRGGLQSCPRNNSESFTLGFSAVIDFDGEKEAFNYHVTLLVRPRPRIYEEELIFEDGPMIFKTSPQSRSSTSSDIFVEYNNFAPGGRKPRTSISSNRSVLSQYSEFAKKGNKKYKQCVSVVTAIMEYLHSSFIFDPNPKLMRSYERIGSDILARNGANLSAVLYRLHEGTDEDKQTLDRLLNWIKQLPEEPYHEIGFVTTKLNDVIFGFIEGAEKRLLDARLLSDGTLRSLAVLTALETVEKYSRVVIEEFDNGLHPSRVHILAEAIVSCCERRNLNVLVTTHNPATLNELKSEQLEGVVLCAWNEEEQSFKLIRLNELPRHDELLERGKLGDLVSKRIIDQYLMPQFEDVRKKEIQEWLRSL